MRAHRLAKYITILVICKCLLNERISCKPAGKQMPRKKAHDKKKCWIGNKFDE